MFVPWGWPKTIRSQLMLGFGAILLVSFTSSAIGYRSLAQLRSSSRALVDNSARVRDLSLELQANFLQARQAEEIYLNRWKTSITAKDVQGLIQENERYLIAARKKFVGVEGPRRRKIRFVGGIGPVGVPISQL